MHLWLAKNSTIFSTAAYSIAERPPKDFDRHWDIREIGEILVTLKTGEYASMPKHGEMCDLLEKKVGVLLANGDIGAERIKYIRELYSENEENFSSASRDALHQAIQDEVNSIDRFLEGIESVEELEDYESNLRDNAIWAGVGIDANIERLIERRREAIEDQTDSPSDPVVTEISADREDKAINNGEMKSMFDELIEHLSLRSKP